MRSSQNRQPQSYNNSMVPARNNNNNNNRAQQSSDPFSRDLMTFGMGNDPFFADFNNMHNNMMSNFSSISSALMKGSPFGDDFFGSSSMFPSAFREEDIFGFSNMHDKLGQKFKGSNGAPGGGQFQVYSQSTVQRQVIGEDGKPKIEKYYNDNHVHRGADGNTVSQGKQAYHNEASGRSIVAHERMLNDQGHKTIKERNRNGEVHDQNLYNNIQEEQAQEFHNRWQQQASNLKSISGPSHKMMQLGNQQNPRGTQQLQLQSEYPDRSSYQNKGYQQQQQTHGYQSPALSHTSNGSNRSRQEAPTPLSNSSQYKNPMASNVRGFQDMNAARTNGRR